MNTSFPSGDLESVGASSASDELLIKAFAKLDKTALGIAVGVVFGLAVFIATISLVIKGGGLVGPNLKLLGQYFIGYTVTVKGSFVGLVYGFVFGFLLGWFTALLRNLLVAVFVQTVKLKAVASSHNDILGDL